MGEGRKGERGRRGEGKEWKEGDGRRRERKVGEEEIENLSLSPHYAK